MENYYDSLISNIENSINDKDFDKALSLIEEEYKMPYIPLYVEDKLRELLKQIPVKEEKKRTFFEDEDIEKMLKGDYDHQLTAIGYLDTVNIRNYLDIVNEYLKNDNPRILKSLLIMTLMNQEIDSEIIMIDKGNEYTFIPSAIEPPHLTDGYVIAEKTIKELLENDDPSSIKMCFEVLLKECYLKLPESYEMDEGKMLGYGIVKAVLLALGNLSDWQRYKEEFSINEDYVLEINI